MAEQRTFNPLFQASPPWRPTHLYQHICTAHLPWDWMAWNQSWNQGTFPAYSLAMSVTPSGHIEELPSGSFRVNVYVGTDPITRKRVYLRETAKDPVQAQIVLGRLLQRAQ